MKALNEYEVYVNYIIDVILYKLIYVTYLQWDEAALNNWSLHYHNLLFTKESKNLVIAYLPTLLFFYIPTYLITYLPTYLFS